MQLALWLESNGEDSAAASLREGLDETPGHLSRDRKPYTSRFRNRATEDRQDPEPENRQRNQLLPKVVDPGPLQETSPHDLDVVPHGNEHRERAQPRRHA